MAETVGTIQVVATINTKDYDAGKKHIERGNQELETGAKKTSGGFSAAWMGAIAGVAASLTNTFMNAVKNSIGDAIKRVDTLNNSTRTFENMGISAKDSSKAMKALQKSIKGLPTPLDSAVRGMTALTATYSDISKGQKVFSALNNAILGFGGTAAMVENAITQLSQLPLDGPLDAQTWNSLRNSGITPVLTAMARDSGMSVAAMKEAFGKGELTVQDFIDKLIKLNTEGGGGLKSLEAIAKDSTAGISTGFANMQTALVRGVANIIEAIGPRHISGAFNSMSDAIDTASKSIVNGIILIKDNANLAIPAIIGLSSALTSTYIPALLSSIPPMRLWSTHLGLMGLQIAKFARLAVVPTIIGAIVGALALMAMNPEATTSIFDTITSSIQNFIQQIPTIVSKIGNFITTEIPAIFQSLLTGIQKVLPLIIPAFISLFNSIFDYLNTNGPSLLETFTKFVTDGANSIANNIDKYAKVGTDIIVSLLDSITKALPGLVNTGVKIITSLLDSITKALPGIIKAGSKIITKIVDSITANLPTIIAAAIAIVSVLLYGIIKALPTLISAAITIINALALALIQNLPIIINAVVQLINALVTAIIDNLPMLIEAAVQLIVALVNGIIGALPQLIQAAVQLILTIVTALIANLPLLIGAAIFLVIQLAKALVGAVPQLIAAAGILIFEMVKALLSLAWQLVKAGGDLIVSLFNGIVKSVGKIGQGIGQIVSTIWNAIKSINLFDAGRDIIKGLWNGINNMSGWISSKIKGFGDNVLRGIKNFFGIKSPSRVMRDQIGIMLGEGMAIGITKSTKMAVNAAKKSVDAIAGAFDTSVNIISTPISREGEYMIPPSNISELLDNYGNNNSNSVTIETLVIEKDVDIDLVARKLGIKQLNTYRGIA